MPAIFHRCPLLLARIWHDGRRKPASGPRLTLPRGGAVAWEGRWRSCRVARARSHALSTNVARMVIELSLDDDDQDTSPLAAASSLSVSQEVSKSGSPDGRWDHGALRATRAFTCRYTSRVAPRPSIWRGAMAARCRGEHESFTTSISISLVAPGIPQRQRATVIRRDARPGSAKMWRVRR